VECRIGYARRKQLMWCSVVQCDAVWCRVMQGGAVWCSAACSSVLQRVAVSCNALLCVAVVLQHSAACCSVVQCGRAFCVSYTAHCVSCVEGVVSKRLTRRAVLQLCCSYVAVMLQCDAV